MAVAFLRVDSFQRPAEHRERLRVGSELHGEYTVPVAQHMATSDGLGTPIPFDVRVRDAAAAAGTLRDALVQAADAETDTYLSACLHKWADRVPKATWVTSDLSRITWAMCDVDHTHVLNK